MAGHKVLLKLYVRPRIRTMQSLSSHKLPYLLPLHERSLAKGSEHEWPRTTTSSSSSSSSSSSRLLLQLQLRLRLRLQVQVRVPLSATGYHLVPVVPLRTRKAAEHQTRSGPVQTHPNSRLHLQGARWRTRCLSLVAARRAVGNILPLKAQRHGRGHLLSKLNVLYRQPHAPPRKVAG